MLCGVSSLAEICCEAEKRTGEGGSSEKKTAGYEAERWYPVIQDAADGGSERMGS